MNFDEMMKLVNPFEIVGPLKALRFLGTRFGATGVNILVNSDGLANLEQLGIDKIDYIVAHHGEQDHSGSIPLARRTSGQPMLDQVGRAILMATFAQLHLPDFTRPR